MPQNHIRINFLNPTVCKCIAHCAHCLLIVAVILTGNQTEDKRVISRGVTEGYFTEKTVSSLCKRSCHKQAG